MIGSTSFRLAVRQHRFEVLVASLLAAGVAAAAVVVGIQLSALGVDASCFIGDQSSSRLGCSNAETYRAILSSQAAAVFAAMAVVPVASGLIGGTPVVAREVETGTAQVAWSLAPVRRTWLIRQVVVIGLLVAVSLALAGLATGWLETLRGAVEPARGFAQHGLHGWIPVLRGLAAFALALFVGAALGRTLPSMILASGLAIALLLGLGLARDFWVGQQSFVVVDSESDQFDGLLVEQAWRDTATGDVHRWQDAYLIASTMAPGEDPEVWLLAAGYRPVQLGVPTSTISGWPWLEGAVLVTASIVFLAGTNVIVNRRRPT